MDTFLLHSAVPKLTFALMGGGGIEIPSSVFFLDCKTTVARRHILSYIFSVYVVKISDSGHARSGHQVTSSELTS